jgi:hypothetical protein
LQLCAVYCFWEARYKARDLKACNHVGAHHVFVIEKHPPPYYVDRCKKTTATPIMPAEATVLRACYTKKRPLVDRFCSKQRRITGMDQTASHRRSAIVGTVLATVIIVLVLATALVHLDKAFMAGLFSNRAARAGNFQGGANRPGGQFGPGNPGNFTRRNGNGGGGIPAGGSSRPRPSGVTLFLFQNMALLYFLDFLGYTVLAVALYLPFLRRIRRLLRWALIVLAALTIAAYFTIVGFRFDPLGYADKSLELLIIIFLIIDDVRSTRQARPTAPAIA